MITHVSRCIQQQHNNDAMHRNHHQDNEALRRQMAIWQDASADADGKRDAEGALLREQVAQRGAELAALRGRVTEVEAERDRALQVGGLFAGVSTVDCE